MEDNILYESFNYNLINKEKSQIELSEGSLNLKYLRMANLENNSTPDLLFSFVTCDGCEAEGKIYAFKYNSKVNKWQIRKWGESDAVLTWSAYQFGDDDRYAYDCIFRIMDFERKGHEQIGTWCKITRTPYCDDDCTDKKTIEDETKLYSVNGGLSSEKVLTDRSEISKINKLICSGENSNKCKVPYFKS